MSFPIGYGNTSSTPADTNKTSPVDINKTSPADINKASPTDVNKSASAENNKISLEEIKVLSKTYSRRAPPNFGTRLAQARGMAPASASSQDHNNAEQADSEGGDIQLPVPVRPNFFPSSVAGPAGGHASSGFLPSHGAAWRPALEPVRRLTFGSNPPTTIPAGGKKPVGVIDQERPVAIRDVVKPRKLLVAPLRLLRSAYARDPEKAAARNFLNNLCPVGGEVTSETDALIPNIVYSVTYLMTHDQFTTYRRMILHCPIANEVQRMLAVGGGEFDQVNERMGTRGLFVEGKKLEEILRELVDWNRLGFTWDLAESWTDPYKTVV